MRPQRNNRNGPERPPGGLFATVPYDLASSLANTFTVDQFITGLEAGQAYVDVHSANLPNGEIRGQILAAAVPEPSTWVMMILGFVGVGTMACRRRNQNASVVAA